MLPLDRSIEDARPRSWPGSMLVKSLYTAGLGTERFLRGLKDEGRILGSRCRTCRATIVPAVHFCERCFERISDWKTVGPQATVHTFSVAHRDVGGATLPKPVLMAFLTFAGARGGFLHKIAEVEPGLVRIGLKVEPVFKPASERVGSLLDISHFRPVATAR